MRGSLEERFWQFVSPEPNSGCWLWTGGSYCAPWSKNTGGYGRIGDHGKTISAHVMSYRMHKGEIPEGMEIDHKCRVTCCVNPDHLEAVPHRINILRGTNPMARQARQTHCKRGHEFTPETTGIYFGNQRICLPCAAARERAKRARLRAARAH